MAITDEKYVLLTTFRKNGDPVATPIWIVARRVRAPECAIRLRFD